MPTPKSAAIGMMKESTDALQQTYDVMEKKYKKASTTLKEQRQLLEAMGAVHAELLTQRIFLLHLQRDTTVVTPAKEETGKALAEALTRLAELRESTDRVAMMLDLASKVAVHLANHRREVDDRASDE